MARLDRAVAPTLPVRRSLERHWFDCSQLPPCDVKLFTCLIMYKLSQTHLATDKRAISLISGNSTTPGAASYFT